MSDSLLLTVGQSTVRSSQRVQIDPTCRLLTVRHRFSYQSGLLILWGPPNPHNPKPPIARYAAVCPLPLCFCARFSFGPRSPRLRFEWPSRENANYPIHIFY